MELPNRTLVMVLAGGKGRRLAPLTSHRAKPSVPFGGRYRIIDFVLSNLVNSGYRNIYILTQYMASSLIRHLNRNWHMAFPGQFLEVAPAQMRAGDHWYRGTADSVWQNRNLIDDAHAQNVAIFGGDHIYKFAVDQMQAFHHEQDADLTIASCPAALSEASDFGVFEIDDAGDLVSFQEKPKNPKPIPGRPDEALVSMGNYFFRYSALQEVLAADIQDSSSSHDFGKDIIPKMLKGGYKVAIYDFSKNRIPGESDEIPPYWRDVGNLDSYFDANMDLRAAVPPLNLYNFRWRIRTAQRNFPPARFVRYGEDGRAGEVMDSLVCEGTIVASSTLRRVVCGYDCFFHADSDVEESILLSGCDIGAGSRLKKVILDKNCSLDPGVVIGEDPEEDRKRFPFVTEQGRVVLPKGTHVPRKGPIELAQDMEEVLRQDPHTAELMKEFAGRYNVTGATRHSHDSVGPRFRKFGPNSID